MSDHWSSLDKDRYRRAPRRLSISVPPLWVTALVAMLVLPFTTGACGSVQGWKYVRAAVDDERRVEDGAGALWVLAAAILIAIGAIMSLWPKLRTTKLGAAIAAVAVVCMLPGFWTDQWRSVANRPGLGAWLAAVILLALVALNVIPYREDDRTRAPPLGRPVA